MFVGMDRKSPHHPNAWCEPNRVKKLKFVDGGGKEKGNWHRDISTWQSTNVHFLQILRLKDYHRQLASSWYVSQREANVAQLFLLMPMFWWVVLLFFDKKMRVKDKEREREKGKEKKRRNLMVSRSCKELTISSCWK